jgi:uncharacterized protein YuzE
MRITYDKKVDAMNIVFQKGKYKINKEIAEGIIIDYTKDEKVLAIEILDVTKRMLKESIESISFNVPMEA